MLMINGVTYETDYELEYSSSFSDGFELRAHFPGSDGYLQDLINQCPHCHRSDLREAVCRSVEEAVERGWLRPVEKQGDQSD